LINLVEKMNALFAGQLSTLRSRHWRIFCGVAHTGHQALLRRISEGRTGLVNYGEAEVVSIMSLAGTFALLSAVELATLSNDEEVLLKIMDKVREYKESGSDKSFKPTPDGAA
jgi:hypothetical protein